MTAADLRGMLGAALLAGAALGALLDLYSLWLWLRRYRLGTGPSGVPLFSLVLFYVPLSMFRRDFLLLLGLAFYHALCQYLIPWIYLRLTKPK